MFGYICPNSTHFELLLIIKLYIILYIKKNEYFYIIGFIYIYNQNAPKRTLIKYIIKNLFGKLLLIYIVINKITYIFSWHDIFVGISMYVSYLLIMVVNNKNPFDSYLQVFDTYINDTHENEKNLSAISKLYDTIYFNLLHKK